MYLYTCAGCGQHYEGEAIEYADPDGYCYLCDRCTVEILAPLIQVEESARRHLRDGGQELVDGTRGGASRATPTMDPSPPRYFPGGGA